MGMALLQQPALALVEHERHRLLASANLAQYPPDVQSIKRRAVARELDELADALNAGLRGDAA